MKSTHSKEKQQDTDSTMGQFLWTFLVAAVLLVLGFYHSVNLTQRTIASSWTDQPTTTFPQDTLPSSTRY